MMAPEQIGSFRTGIQLYDRLINMSCINGLSILFLYRWEELVSESLV